MHEACWIYVSCPVSLHQCCHDHHAIARSPLLMLQERRSDSASSFVTWHSNQYRISSNTTARSSYTKSISSTPIARTTTRRLQLPLSLLLLLLLILLSTPPPAPTPLPSAPPALHPFSTPAPATPSASCSSVDVFL